MKKKQNELNLEFYCSECQKIHKFILSNMEYYEGNCLVISIICFQSGLERFLKLWIRNSQIVEKEQNVEKKQKKQNGLNLKFYCSECQEIHEFLLLNIEYYEGNCLVISIICFQSGLERFLKLQIKDSQIVEKDQEKEILEKKEFYSNI